MASQNSHAIKAPLGVIAMDGQGAIKVTDINVSASASEITARSGCDKTFWYRAVDLTDWNGSFTATDTSPLLFSLATGGEISPTGSSAYAIANNEEQTLATTVTLDNGNYLTDEDTFAVCTVTKVTTTGETVFKQVAATPGAGEFAVASASSGTLTFNAADTGTVKVTYAYEDATRTHTDVEKDDEPGYVSLLIPYCGVTLSNPNNSDPVGYYFPRVRIVGIDHSVTTDAGSLQGITYNFVAVPDGNGLVVRRI